VSSILPDLRHLRFDHQHVEALRRTVDSGCEARRTCADNDEIANWRVIDRRVEPKAICDLAVGRILQHRFAATDQHRHIVDADVKAIEDLLRLAIVDRDRCSERVPFRVRNSFTRSVPALCVEPTRPRRRNRAR
jgi:hypothetical protein